MNDSPVVVLDPGHGGTAKVGGSSANNATGPSGLLEKNLTLDLARRVRELIRNEARVLLTRDDDVNVSLADRAAVARDNQASLFLSIHFNGFADSSVDGTEVWIAREANQPSRDFAQTILSEVVGVTGVRNRGIKQNNFGVLVPGRHHAATGACLLEVAFLTNHAQDQRLGDTGYRDAIAAAVANAVRQHVGSPVGAGVEGSGLSWESSWRPPAYESFGSGSQTVNLAYDVPLIPQPNKLACWAASMAMMVNYYTQTSRTPESLAQEVNRSLRTSYGWDMLEQVKDRFRFQAIELPSNLSFVPEPREWQNWLSTYGPLWVTTLGAPSHAIVVHGISGDLTPAGTTIKVLNPWDTRTNFDNDEVDFNPPNRGYAYEHSFQQFASEFGNLGLANYGNWRVLYLGIRGEGQGQSFDASSRHSLSLEGADADDVTVNVNDSAPLLTAGQSLPVYNRQQHGVALQATDLQDAVTRAMRSLSTETFPERQRQRLQCLMAWVRNNPEGDDRYFNGMAFEVKSTTQHLTAEQLDLVSSHVRADLQRSIAFGPDNTPQQIRDSLDRLDRRILSGINLFNLEHRTMGVAMPAAHLQMKDIVADAQRNRGSAYWCYGEGQ